MFLIPLEIRGHTVPHRKALRYGKYEPRGLSCADSILSICQDVWKSGNLLYKLGSVHSLTETTVLLANGAKLEVS